MSAVNVHSDAAVPLGAIRPLVVPLAVLAGVCFGALAVSGWGDVFVTWPGTALFVVSCLGVLIAVAVTRAALTHKPTRSSTFVDPAPALRRATADELSVQEKVAVALAAEFHETTHQWPSDAEVLSSARRFSRRMRDLQVVLVSTGTPTNSPVRAAGRGSHPASSS